MNAELFIKSIIEVVHKPSVSDITSDLLEAPAGRKPPEILVELHSWYTSLDVKSQAMISLIIEQSVHSSIFGVLATLDGSRGIEDGVKEGEFEITYKNVDGSFNLNKSMDLHDEYQSQIYDRVFGK
jgi:hypothetical protein